MACAGRSPALYMVGGLLLPVEELVISNGALEALNLCLQVVTRPGDLVAIEAPAFYATLQVLERLKLKAVEIPVHPREGIDLEVLADSLERLPIKACWFMSNFQNPMGASMDDEKKRPRRAAGAPPGADDRGRRVRRTVLRQQAPKPVRAYDQEGLVMHCSSFSKSLAPGYRVGWVAGGRYAEQIERLKLMTSLSASIPPRRPSPTISSTAATTATCAAALRPGDPAERHARGGGGYFPSRPGSAVPAAATSSGWVARGGRLVRLFQLALAQGISLARGRSSPPPPLRPLRPLNYGHPWSARQEKRWSYSGGSPSRWRDDAPHTESHPA